MGGDNNGSKEIITRLLPVKQDRMVAETRLRADSHHILKVWYERQMPNTAMDMYHVKEKRKNKLRFLVLTSYSRIPKVSSLLQEPCL